MDRLKLFQALISLAASDGKFTDEEVAFLVSRADLWKIPTEEFELALVGIHERGPELSLPTAQPERIRFLKELIQMMAADGERAEVEKRLLATASAQMEFSGSEFAEILDEVVNRR